MLKKMQLIVAFALVALFSNVFGQDKGLDVIIRDFPVTAGGFEEFMGCDGKDRNKDPKRSSSNPEAKGICFNNEDKYYICDIDENKIKDICNDKGGNVSGVQQLCYGGHQENNRDTRKGYTNGPHKNDPQSGLYGGSDKNLGVSWANPIIITPKMVKDDLFYDKDHCPAEDIVGENGDPDYIRYRYCARPVENSGHCGSKGRIEGWFKDGGEAKRVIDVVELKYQSDGTFMINHDFNTKKNWNGFGDDGGYFPLDKFSDDEVYGKQSLNMWCDNRDYPSNECSKWGTFELPNKNPAKDPNAAKKAADNDKDLKARWHNYGFSLSGTGTFKYNPNSNNGKGDVFEFIGDDDMWIFIDGKLAADLGGIHLAAPAKININELASDRGWEANSLHSINFFYMDRNTDGSNFKLKMALNELSAPRFGAPRILKAETTQNPDGSSSTTIYVSNKLDEKSIKQFVGEKDKFPIVINKVGNNNLYGFQIESISELGSQGSDGYAYTITGKVCKSKTECGGIIISSGDSLSFNVLFDDLRDGGYKIFDGLALPDDGWYIKSSANNPATKIAWGINTTSMPPIVFNPDVADKDVRKPDFNVDIWFTGDPDGGKGKGGGAFSNGGGSLPGFGNTGGTFPKITQIWDNSQNKLVDLPNGNGNNTVHGFGTKGTPIPPNRAGELILTAYPNAGMSVHTSNGNIPYAEWDTSSTYQKLFGLPPKPDGDNLYGIADPTVTQPNGGYMFVKNGFKGESSVGGIQVAPTRCIADRDELIDGDAPRINCLNFSLPAKQPFRLAVTVYDQLGNFVTQYSEKVDEQEFRSVVQGPTFIDKTKKEGDEGYVYPSGSCRYPKGSEDFGNKEIITTNGLVKVNVNIYPFSKDGRRIGNGVYILKVDRVDLPYEGCMNSAGTASWIEERFVRYHADMKFGWIRTK